MNCLIESYLGGRWQTAAIFEPDPQMLDRGIEGGGRLQYAVDYAVAHLNRPDAELIPGLPVGFELLRHGQWPPFLIDLLPAGAGRRAWLRRLNIKQDGPHADWHLLVRGAGNPPGNLRIAAAVPQPPPDQFKIGFPRRDIIEQQEGFLEYAEERGAYVAGASSVQGEAPKFLLVEDHNGMFHADGALADGRVKQCWLVKFARGVRSDQRNQQVLRNEAPYLEVARQFGARVGTPLAYEDGVLFVPRFDRQVTAGRVDRFGMHSLYAVAGIPGYGAVVRHDVFCRALAKVVTDPERELREYLLRDVLNLTLANTDNHGRNTAILRSAGMIRLAPLYDFAPMFLDPEGIGRVSRWEDERPGGQPEWGAVCEKLAAWLDPAETRHWLAGLAEAVGRLPALMQACRIDDDITQRLAGRIREVAAGLHAARPRLSL